MRLQFALHEHTVAMSRAEYEHIKNSWTTSTTDFVKIQQAVVGPDMCIAFLDKNRLIQITCIQLSFTQSSSTMPSGPSTLYDTTLAPCPIVDIEAFKANLRLPQYQQALRHPKKTNAIYFEITEPENNYLWKGIGTSHAVEILHLA